MNVSQLATEEATPDFVLAVIQNSHRQQCFYDPEADPDVSLDFESTVSEWREACDLIGWRPLGRALNREFRLNYCDDEWQAVLEPADSHTLYQVCLFIAVRARQPVLRPITILGASCLRAAAFRAVQDVLHNAGADVRSLRPSTPLADYTRRYLSEFLGPISQLVPGALPHVSIKTPVYDIVMWLLPCAMVLAIVAWATSFHSTAILLASIGAAAYLTTWLSGLFRPSSVRFGNLVTFRDLAAAMCDKAST